MPIAVLVVVLLLAWSWSPAEMRKATSLVTDWHNMVDLLSEFMKPNFRDWKVFVEAMVETVQIAIWAPYSQCLSAHRFPSWPRRMSARYGSCSPCAA